MVLCATVRMRPVLLQNSVMNVHVDDFLHLRGEKHVALGTKADSALKVSRFHP